MNAYENLLFFLGNSGFLILLVVLMRLSERMGQGLGLKSYYYIYYAAILLFLAAMILLIVSQTPSKDTWSIAYALFIIGDLIALLISFKYWWWLKKELVGKK